MSDFVSRDMLPDLWEEILRRHWTFLETEESMLKLEERKKLESCLKEFLCIVPHDRKFFLPETSQVLKESIKEMDDFSAYKAMLGFESISQYANNLFTKPWRKEYRVIKMYSGFYQHEIKSNLVDAEKLFEAMGYRQLPNQMLILDGPICPDQVTNVSRDAMAAYVECQIMKQIFSGLTSMQISCSWIDILSFRESHVGGASQAAKAIAYSIREKRFRKEKLNSENCYATIQHTQTGPPLPPPPSSQQMVSSCSNCMHTTYHMPSHQSSQQIPNGCAGIHSQQQHQNYSNIPCSIHNQSSAATGMYMTPNNLQVSGLHYKNHQSSGGYPQMSHSKSLEHYSDHLVVGGGGSSNGGSNGAIVPPPIPHRHSFDQSPQSCETGRNQHLYESPYDCIDGGVAAGGYQNGGGCNFNAYSHPYNVSGNRYPLPYNISNQLNSQYATCTGPAATHYPPQSAGTIIAGCGHKVPIGPSSTEHLYSDCNGFPKKLDPCSYHGRGGTMNGKDFQSYRQRSFPPDQQLIDFDEGPPQSHINHHSRSQGNSFDYTDRIYDNRTLRPSRSASTQYHHHQDYTNQTPKDLYNRNIESSDDVDGNYTCSARLDKKRQPSSERYTKILDTHHQSFEKTIDNKINPLPTPQQPQHQRGLGGTDSYDSYDDHQHETPNKPVKNKNQDGVGSFELWDYVFQNLEKQGYTKDLGERGDLLVQSLDLDSMKLTETTGGTSADKRRSRIMDVKPRYEPSSKARPLEKPTIVPVTAAKEISVKPLRNGIEKSILKNQHTETNGTGTYKTILVQKPLKSTLKNGTATNMTMTNNNVEDQITVNGGSGNGGSSSTSAQGKNATTNGATTQLTTTTVIVTSPNEWSCRFCTFLNPDTKRICDMCCRSKDFNNATNTPTCV